LFWVRKSAGTAPINSRRYSFKIGRFPDLSSGQWWLMISDEDKPYFERT